MSVLVSDPYELGFNIRIDLQISVDLSILKGKIKGHLQGILISGTLQIPTCDKSTLRFVYSAVIEEYLALAVGLGIEIDKLISRMSDLTVIKYKIQVICRIYERSRMDKLICR